MDLSGDKALESAADDRLGFAATAEAIAAAALRQTIVDGLVIGIEGRWGSGKSSLLNMTRLWSEFTPSDVMTSTLRM